MYWLTDLGFVVKDIETHHWYTCSHWRLVYILLITFEKLSDHKIVVPATGQTWVTEAGLLSGCGPEILRQE